MIFAGIDVNIITHEKAEAAGIEAFGLWCWAMCWAQVHASDGRVPRLIALRALGGKRNATLAQRLVDVGLWSANEDGSWTIHNYAKKNQTAEEIQRKKEAARRRKEAWKLRQLENENAAGTRSGTRSEHVSERPLQLQTQTPPDNTTTKPNIIGGQSAAPSHPTSAVVEIKHRKRPETPCPDSDSTAGQIRDWAERWKIDVGHAEFVGFLDHHRKSDQRWRDWGAAWRTWLKNAPKFAGRTLFNRPNNIVQPSEDRAWKVPEGMR